jgi:DNA transformation protein and related proteins
LDWHNTHLEPYNGFMRRLALRMFRWWCAFVARAYRHFETDPSRLAVAKLKNITPLYARLLEDIGVQTRSDLVRLGALEAYRLVLEAGTSPNQALLLALHGAITQQDSSQLNPKEVAYLLEEANALQSRVPEL